MSATGFQVDWLNERFRYDNAARNPEVEQAFLQTFKSKEKLYLVDIGSGTGANALYFMERLFKHQDWTLIEQDAELCEATKVRIIRFLEDYNFYYRLEDGVFKIKVWEYRVKVRILNASFFDLKSLVDLEETDVVLAAAVFDVLPMPQFNEMAETILAAKAALFTTMNYQAMRFNPVDHSDADYVNAYESHMLREQQKGRAMGPQCSAILEAFFEKKKLKFTKGMSRWNLDARAKKMHSFLLNFMKGALNEMEYSSSDSLPFDQWLLNKQDLSRKGALNIEVDHFDFFVKP